MNEVGTCVFGRATRVQAVCEYVCMCVCMYVSDMQCHVAGWIPGAGTQTSDGLAFRHEGGFAILPCARKAAVDKAQTEPSAV